MADNDIEKYEQKENKPAPPPIENVLDKVEIPELDLENAESIGTAVDNLGVMIMACAWKLAKRTMNNFKISESDYYKVTEMQKQFKFIRSTYEGLVKSGRLSNGKVAGPTQETDKNFLDKIKKMHSSIGSIVQDNKQVK